MRRGRMSSGLELRLLGVVELSGAPRAELDAVLAQPKRLALLAYLALNRDGGFARRDTIVGAFWPELDDAHARNALSQALRFLRRHLGDVVILRRGEEEVRLNSDAIRCDVELFEQACSLDDHVRAIELYRGELLAGLFVNDAPGFDVWLESRRADLARRYWRSLEGAADQYQRTGELGRAAECWRQRAAAEPHNSAVAMKLMRALAAAGDRAGAIEHASVHVRRLAADLETTPDASLVALAGRLRSDSDAMGGRASDRELTGPPGAVERESLESRRPSESRLPNVAVALATPRVIRPASALPIAGLALIGLVAALVAVSPRSDTRPKRVVVGIFENQTGDSSLARIGALAADWITQGLQKTGFVDVLPSGSIPTSARESSHAAPRDELRALRKLGQVTGAAYVVNGTIALDGERLRFQPQIVETSSLRLVGAPSPVVVDQSDPMRGIEELRQHVMGSLASVLDPRVATWAATSANPPSLAAFSEFQIGMDELIVRHRASDAIVHFQRAGASDSSYVVPRLWMAQALMRMKAVSAPRVDSVLASVERSRDRLAPADALLLDRLQAIRRDDSAGATRASIKLAALAPSSYFVQMLAEDAGFANRPHEALEILSRLHPDWPWVREWQEYWSLLAYTLHATGDFERELTVARQARAIRPLSRRYLWLECQALAGLGRVDEVRALVATIDTLPRRDESAYADGFRPDGLLRNVGLELRAHGYREAGRAMLERADAWYASRATVEPPSVGDVHQHMLVASELGRWSETVAAARVVLDSIPDDAMPTAMIGIAAASLGDTAAARRQLAIVTRTDTGRDMALHLYEGAKTAAALGDRTRAIELLTAAFAAGRRHTFWDHLAVSFEPLRDLPAYRELMQPTR